MILPGDEDPNPTIPSAWFKHRARLERDADALLEAGYRDRLSKRGMMTYGPDSKRVWSLDQHADIHGDVSAPDLWLGTAPEHDTQGVVADVALTCGLTRSEIELVEAVADGAEVGPYGWSEPLADRFRKTPGHIRKTWSTGRKKIIKHWANEPEPHTSARTRSCAEGNGHTLFIGKPVVRGAKADPGEAAEAMVRHAEQEYRNRDWRYERSLTEDGWQLGDDNLWGDWTPTSEL